MINQEYKDRLFCAIFGREEHKRWTLSLYNAVNGTSYDKVDEIEISTIGEAVYMGMHNDVSFLLCGRISLYEQQSTYNPNMPVRLLMYLGKSYDKLIKSRKQNLYGTTLITLPMPKLVVFYNGKAEAEDEVILKLSDAFPEDLPASESDVDVRVRMLNVNAGRNDKLLESCKPLKEYAWLIDRIRKNKASMEIEPAVDAAIDEMPDEFEIKDYLTGHRAEVKDMCITEYNEAETMQMFKEEGIEIGEEKLANLISRLISCGRTGDVETALKDSSARARLYEEFSIT